MQIARRGPSYPPHFRARHDYRGLDSTAETFGITILYWVVCLLITAITAITTTSLTYQATTPL